MRPGEKAPRDKNGLTPKQRAFVNEYPKDNNGTQAAIRAGCSEDSAHVTASKWLKNPKVRRALGLKLQRAEITSDWVLKRLRLEAEGKKVPDTTQSGRVAALNSIAKIQGYVTDKTQVSGPDGGPLTVNVITYAEKDGEE